MLNGASETATRAIGIRVLAGGALSATRTRHPLGMPVEEPVGSGSDYAADVRRARPAPLVTEGHADDFVGAGLRFAISHPALTSALVGYSTLAQLEHAVASVKKSLALDRGIEARCCAAERVCEGVEVAA
jgi:aryl-alcohol dehydrogenase-like predicted oxidoreductase